MILPTKHLPQERALLTVGADILRLLGEPKTESRLWDELKKARASQPMASALTYDWFVLAIDLLFAMKAIDIERGRIRKAMP
ncbi:MAG: ABC-three component system middle component 6 [Thermoguttaceae bacterium]|jgi:hypothetical protein